MKRTYKAFPLSLIICLSAPVCHAYQAQNGTEHSYVKDTVNPTVTVAQNATEAIQEKAQDLGENLEDAVKIGTAVVKQVIEKGIPVVKKAAAEVIKNVQEETEDTTEEAQIINKAGEEKAHDTQVSAEHATQITKEAAHGVAKKVQEKVDDAKEVVQEKAHVVSSAIQHKAHDIKDALYEKAIQVEAAILAVQNKNLHQKLDKAHKEIDRLRDTNQHITSELEVTRRNVQIACDKVNDVDHELHKIDKVIHA